MDSQVVIERLKPLVKENLIPLSLGSIGLILFAYGLIAFLGSSQSSSGLTFHEGKENSASESAVKKIMVDVEGAVIKPGVYQLKGDTRVSDALVAAFGLSAEADRSWIEKNLNLAAKLTDSSKIYIPRVNEAAASSKTSSFGVTTASGIQSSTANNSSLININTASLSELDTLEGIGTERGQKIIDNRPYGSIDELLSKKVVGQKVFEGIKEKITTN